MKKTKAKTKELKAMLKLLKEAQEKIVQAAQISDSVAHCCQSSLESLLDEMYFNIENTNSHLEDGFLLEDLIEGAS